MKKIIRAFAAWAAEAYGVNRFDLVYDAGGVVIALGGIAAVSAAFGLVLRAAGAG